jgi:hypothetical protein
MATQAVGDAQGVGDLFGLVQQLGGKAGQEDVPDTTAAHDQILVLVHLAALAGVRPGPKLGADRGPRLDLVEAGGHLVECQILVRVNFVRIRSKLHRHLRPKACGIRNTSPLIEPSWPSTLAPPKSRPTRWIVCRHHRW